jgi:hypothetical protein
MKEKHLDNQIGAKLINSAAFWAPVCANPVSASEKY